MVTVVHIYGRCCAHRMAFAVHIICLHTHDARHRQQNLLVFAAPMQLADLICRLLYNADADVVPSDGPCVQYQ